MKHKHAELMKLYAKDAAETDKPWERWVIKHERTGEWRQCNNNPTWHFDMEYRRKPEKTYMWHWVCRDEEGTFISDEYYYDALEASQDYDIICRADWTRIEVQN
jgi:hypothetical protein